MVNLANNSDVFFKGTQITDNYIGQSYTGANFFNKYTFPRNFPSILHRKNIEENKKYPQILFVSVLVSNVITH